MMRKIIFILSLMGFGISSVAQEAYLSREAYRNKVEAYSQLLKQQRLKAAASTEARKIAQTGFLPKIDITAEGTANLNRLDDWNSPAGQYRPTKYIIRVMPSIGTPRPHWPHSKPQPVLKKSSINSTTSSWTGLTTAPSAVRTC